MTHYKARVLKIKMTDLETVFPTRFRSDDKSYSARLFNGEILKIDIDPNGTGDDPALKAWISARMDLDV